MTYHQIVTGQTMAHGLDYHAVTWCQYRCADRNGKVGALVRLNSAGNGVFAVQVEVGTESGTTFQRNANKAPFQAFAFGVVKLAVFMAEG